MSTKKQLKEISAALANASKLHKGQSEELFKIQEGMEQVREKLEQPRYGKELFPGGKHSGHGNKGRKSKKGKKPRKRPSKADKAFVKARDERKANEELAINTLETNTKSKNPRFLQDAYLAGGSRPMTQGNTVQSGNTNAPNMGNFGGAMNMSGVPNTPVDPMTGMPMNYGMMQDEKSADEKAAKIGVIARRKIKKAVEAGNYSVEEGPDFKEVPDDGYSDERRRQMLIDIDAIEAADKKRAYLNREIGPVKQTLQDRYKIGQEAEKLGTAAAKLAPTIIQHQSVLKATPLITAPLKTDTSSFSYKIGNKRPRKSMVVKRNK